MYLVANFYEIDHLVDHEGRGADEIKEQKTTQINTKDILVLSLDASLSNHCSCQELLAL